MPLPLNYPLSAYGKYIGRPLYRFARKQLHRSRFTALAIADTPGSLVSGGLSYLLFRDGSDAFIATVGHQAIAPLTFQFLHAINVGTRRMRTLTNRVRGSIAKRRAHKRPREIESRPFLEMRPLG